MNTTFHRALCALAGVALAAPALLVTTAASAAPRQPLDYDALGDSFAAGVGVLPNDGPCGRSQAAYAVQIDGRMKIDLDDFVACGGATTASLVSGGQLAALDADTDLVTLTIGGNDIGWGTVVTACLGGTDAQCAATVAASRAAITMLLPARLDSVYAQIRAGAPSAHVVVTGYPRLFSPEYGSFLGASTAEQAAMNEAADLLNSVIVVLRWRTASSSWMSPSASWGTGSTPPSPGSTAPSIRPARCIPTSTATRRTRPRSRRRSTQPACGSGESALDIAAGGPPSAASAQVPQGGAPRGPSRTRPHGVGGR